MDPSSLNTSARVQVAKRHSPSGPDTTPDTALRPTCTIVTPSKYRPPPTPTDLRGVLVACTVIGCWAVTFHWSIFRLKLSGPDASPLWKIVTAFLLLEYLYTGLFITTHDAMHGSIAFKRKWLNDLIGQVAISLYAWFDYQRLYKKHWEHHDHTGITGMDPDFHRGDPSLPVWFAQFMWEYMTWQQFAKITAAVGVLIFAFGAPVENIMLYMTAAAVLSAFRLFYYGTYVPHRPDNKDEVMNWERSRTCDEPRLVSMLKCYHFDCHWEHHRWPYAPWWRLYDFRNYQRAITQCTQQ